MHRIKSSEEYQQAYKSGIQDPQAFWAEQAEHFQWHKKWDTIHSGGFENGDIKWFDGAQLNITENCLDRHLETRGNQTAIIWEPNDPNEEAKHITYKELHANVCRMANVLKNNGAKKSDRICIYMPMALELAYAVLACARIGAVHSVVFAGFSSKSLADRINDANCNIILTADGSFRGAKTIGLKKIVDEALESCDSIDRCIVLQRTSESVHMQDGRDVWLHHEWEKVTDDCPAEIMDAEDMLFILYTSGSTGKPKGMVHTCGGYMIYTNYTFRNVFQYNDGDIYWCTADIGWITGHSYIIYGPLSAGATTIMFEGVPSYPDMGRFWEVCEKHKVNTFYTAPTAIRALQKADTSFVTKYDLSSLRVLGTVGEPINAEAWEWYKKYVGKDEAPIVDTWWQTETGGIMITSLAGVTPEKATYATLPMPGIQPALMTVDGDEIEGNNVEGRLCIKHPWPSIARTIYGDHKRYLETYMSAFPGNYFTGDGCKRDDNGMYRITGRVDDVIIVSGHNLGTAEIEDAINQHDAVCESAVVGYPHDVKGNSIYAYVTPYKMPENEAVLKNEVVAIVSKLIGPIAKPEKIQFTPALPKTRSGKIMRRILRKIASGDMESLGDTSTLLNPDVVEDIKTGAL